MSKLDDSLDSLGLQEYSERLASHGFETWDDLVDISEEMMADVGLKRGHRRKLQRGIASYQGKPYSNPLSVVYPDGFLQEEEGAVATNIVQNRGKRQEPPPLKRRYRRHEPKDPSAPIRPKSDYVLFSNHLRQDRQVSELAFIDISRLVGKKWQGLSPEERASWASRAAEDKRRYENELEQYQGINDYQRYQDRLRIQRLDRNDLETNLTPTRGSRSLESSVSSISLPEVSPVRISAARDYSSEGNAKRSPDEKKGFSSRIQSAANSSSPSSPVHLFQMEQVPFQHDYNDWDRGIQNSTNPFRPQSIINNFNTTTPPSQQNDFGVGPIHTNGHIGAPLASKSLERRKSFHILALNPFRMMSSATVWPFLNNFLKYVNIEDHYVDALDTIQKFELAVDPSVSLPNNVIYTLCLCISIGCQIDEVGTDEMAIVWYENGRRYLDNDDWEWSLDVMRALALVSRFHRVDRPTTARHYLDIAMKIGEVNNLSGGMEIDSPMLNTPNLEWLRVWATMKRLAGN